MTNLNPRARRQEYIRRIIEAHCSKYNPSWAGRHPYQLKLHENVSRLFDMVDQRACKTSFRVAVQLRRFTNKYLRLRKEYEELVKLHNENYDSMQECIDILKSRLSEYETWEISDPKS